ncbi:MAG TPA: hypothetical protein VGH27_20680 [Streptosporangiaceae bacterium]
MNFYTGEVQVGSTETLGVGLGMPTASVGGSNFVANAPCLSDLKGLFGQVGGSVDVGGLVPGGDVFTGQSPNNQNIYGASTSLGVGYDFGPLVAGFEVHGEATYTWQQTFFHFSF